MPAENATSVGCSGQEAHTLYDELIVPLAPFVFKALVWYQVRHSMPDSFRIRSQFDASADLSCAAAG